MAKYLRDKILANLVNGSQNLTLKYLESRAEVIHQVYYHQKFGKYTFAKILSLQYLPRTVIIYATKYK